MKVLDLSCNTINYLCGEKVFQCCRCLKHHTIFTKRRRIISITQELAYELGKEELVGKLEFVPFCQQCYPVTKKEF